ncbi:MAG: class I SAM-dependent methyltransferase [Stellaceae bacterium]
MGRFETTAPTYATHREPYPPAFFAAAADALKLAGREALIDLGTGPGLLALGFAPYVGRIVGVDPEPAMIAEARRAAAAAKVKFPVIEGRAEDVPADLGPFDLVAIGRALHWLDRDATLATFDRILAPKSRILICGSSPLADEKNPWRPAYESVLVAWGDHREGRHFRLHENWFEGTRFAEVAKVTTTHRQAIGPQDLVERALTRSTSSPAILGSRIQDFRADMLKALTPCFPNGVADEVIESRATIFAAAF